MSKPDNQERRFNMNPDPKVFLFSVPVVLLANLALCLGADWWICNRPERAVVQKIEAKVNEFIDRIDKKE